MSLLPLASALIVLGVPQNSAIQVNVDAKNGDTVSGTKVFRVTVDSSTAIQQVEFYIGNTLADTETSTPYMFTLDTIEDPDGDLKIRFKAYTAENKTAEKALTLHVDNKRSAGAPFHIQAGLDALTDSKWQKAIDEGRIAMKIDPQSTGARIVLARANLGMNVLDKAQNYAEQATQQDPKNDTAYQLLAGINIKRAFSTYAKEGADKSQVMSSISDSFKSAIDARNKSLDIEVDGAGAPSGDNLLRYVDVALAASRFSLAIAPLQDAIKSDPKNLKVVDRLAYAQLRSGRYNDALETLRYAKSQTNLDAYADAVLAEVYWQFNDTANATQAMVTANEEDPDDLGVRTAQAYIALKQNKTSVLAGLVKDLARDQGQRADVNYFLMALSDRLQQYNEARTYFQTAVLAEPTMSDIYVEQANYSIDQSFQKDRKPEDKAQDYAEAKMFYQLAAQARPEAVDALAGIASVNMFLRNVQDAVRYAEAARDAAPDAALGHYVCSGAYQLAGRLNEAQTEMKRASQLDQGNLEGREIPSPTAVWKYLIAGGRVPVMSRPQ
ncbi:MAG TPA: Ig-like domain-containing protein [Fimbriimonas sp.]|nr:Ig-like domain-containing protein [Fimbriimonas sp.]